MLEHSDDADAKTDMQTQREPLLCSLLFIYDDVPMIPMSPSDAEKCDAKMVM